MRRLGAVQFWLPDSPRWLLLSGAGRTRAERDLIRARGSTADAAAVQRELAGIEKSVREAQAMANPGAHLFVTVAAFAQCLQVHPDHSLMLEPCRRASSLFCMVQEEACQRSLCPLTWRYAGDCDAGFLGLFKGRYLKPLTVGTSLMLFQQITGQPSVLYYAADIFNKAGIDAGKDATGVSVILGIFKLVMTGGPAADASQHAIMVPSIRDSWGKL